jgi:hypothetical protein
MQTKVFLFIGVLSASIISSSCNTKMYQVLETGSPELSEKSDSLIFENSDVKVSYDFWTNGGKVDFLIFNKLNAPIYVDWDKSHLIYNGVAYEYWYDSQQASSMISSTSTGSSNAWVNS